MIARLLIMAMLTTMAVRANVPSALETTSTALLSATLFLELAQSGYLRPLRHVGCLVTHGRPCRPKSPGPTVPKPLPDPDKTV